MISKTLPDPGAGRREEVRLAGPRGVLLLLLIVGPYIEAEMLNENLFVFVYFAQFLGSQIELRIAMWEVVLLLLLLLLILHYYTIIVNIILLLVLLLLLIVVVVVAAAVVVVVVV